MPDCPELVQLIDSTKEIAALQTVEELLNWDQRTLMPPKAAGYRAEQLTVLSGLIHQKMTDPIRGEWLEVLESSSEIEPDSDAGVIVAQVGRQYHKEKKVPQALVEELAKTRVLAHESWIEARKANDYSLFSSYLESVIRLLKEKTEAIGYETCAYDVLVDDYEPEARSADIETVFRGLRDELVPLLDLIQGSSQKPDPRLVSNEFPVDRQREIGVQAAKAIGFDFRAGRLDETHHPFCTTLGPYDCRITTRYDQRLFGSAFFGTLHEAGHGLYEQGLRSDQFGLPTGEYCSLGIHESQSRLWENMVGRSMAFWKWYYPTVQRSFPDILKDIEAADFFGAVNSVKPSLVRVEADEATYSLHIIIRFELEREIFSNEVTVADLPDAWNEKYEKYLGIRPETANEGILQDVHWSEALFGYFPTYALGNLYAAHFMQSADRALGGVAEPFEKGEFEPLLGWLRDHVHQFGKSKSATQTLEHATGESLSHQPLMEYLRQKYSVVYGI